MHVCEAYPARANGLDLAGNIFEAVRGDEVWRLYLAGTAAGYTVRDDREGPPTNVTSGGRDGPRGDSSSPAELCSGCGGGVCGSSSSARDTNGQISLRHGY